MYRQRDNTLHPPHQPLLTVLAHMSLAVTVRDKIEGELQTSENKPERLIEQDTSFVSMERPSRFLFLSYSNRASCNPGWP